MVTDNFQTNENTEIMKCSDFATMITHLVSNFLSYAVELNYIFVHFENQAKNKKQKTSRKKNIDNRERDREKKRYELEKERKMK